MISFASVIGSIVGLFVSQKLFGKKHLIDLHWLVVVVSVIVGGLLFQLVAIMLSARLGYDTEPNPRMLNPLFVLALFFIAKWLNRREAKNRT